MITCIQVTRRDNMHLMFESILLIRSLLLILVSPLQLTVLNKGSVSEFGGSSSKVRNFHFRVKENNVDYFYPGSQT